MSKQWKQWDTLFIYLFLVSKITADSDCSYEIKRHLLLWRKAMTKPRQHIKQQSHYFANKGPSSQSYGFLIVMYGCESWTIKKAACRRIDAFELWCWRTLESPLDCNVIKPVNLKGSQPWILIQRTDTKTEALTFWSPDVNSWLSCKVPDAWKDWRQEEKKVSRGLDGWRTSLMQWTWTWANLERWGGTGRPGML